MIKVLILGDYPQFDNVIFGGVQATVFYIAQEMSKIDGVSVDIISINSSYKNSYSELRNGLNIHFVKSSEKFALSTLYFRDYLKVRGIIKRINPDIIHAHGSLKYPLIAMRTGYKYIVTPHGFGGIEANIYCSAYTRIKVPVISAVERYCLKKAPYIISISPYRTEYLSKLTKAKVFTIQNPVEKSFFDLPSEGEAGRILYAGLVTNLKGIDKLIESFKIVLDGFSGATLRIAGGYLDAGFYNLLIERVRELKMEDSVNFLGQINQPRILEEYAKAGIVVLPSFHDVSPLAVMQAMAAGKPVVATKVGGTPFIVRDSETGFLVNYGDIEGFADRILILLNDSNLSKKMSSNARRVASEEYHSSKIAGQTVQVYKSILG